ncbi:diacylglycerol kinase [Escherichia coli]|nr:diacylglycerol kinase [Escherichia coli]EIW7623867.1 diacylglycerol kinase [Escherichia coli]EIY5815374.1 diacylglycerol kinase [Escherichia coli]EIY5894933.1 diacylglycerol kinase [Escherichia coli]EIY6988229.1 diacylglycerol kinase [Escherichia coli]
MANTTTGVTRIIKAAGYSWKGLCAAWRYEAAFRQESILVLSALIISFWLDVDSVTRVLLIGSAMMVIIVEIINSAIEAVVDRIGSEHHELSGRAKDMGSAAVLITILVAIIIWGVLLLS